MITPSAVERFRPSDPCTSSGFPVMTPGTCCFACMLYVSIIQAMICGFVFTSGAGTSLSMPKRSDISAK